jgi:hypothetical protein
MAVEQDDIGTGGTPLPPSEAVLPDTDEGDVLIGRAVRRIVAELSRDETVRIGLEALARSILGTEPPAQVAPRTADDASEGLSGTATTGVIAQPIPDEPVQPMDPQTLKALVERAARGADTEELGPLAAILRRAADLPNGDVATRPPAPIARQETSVPPAPPESSVPERDAVLPGLVERTRLKAIVARSVAQQLATGASVDENLLHRARSAGCSTWMLGLVDAEPEDLDVLATCFDAVADAAELSAMLHETGPLDRERLQRAVRGFAAVQSALRVTVAGHRRTPDEDQVVAFEWLKETTAAERIFVERHMRLDDPLPPAEVATVTAPLRAELEELRSQEDRQESRTRGLRQVRYHANRLAKGKGSDHDRDKIVEAVTDLVADGLPPSNLELRAMLLPILDRLAPAEGEPAAYGRVIADVEAHLERERRNGEMRATPRKKDASDEVRRAAALLRGTELVLIGGERRPETTRALTDAFGLSELTWYTLSDDPTLDQLERAISRPDVSVVVQLIRWSRHRHGEADEIADKHGKAFVRVPSGTNPNAIARAILDQASERLGQGIA